MSDPTHIDLAAKAREETFRRLAEGEHYSRLARGFLEIGDDCGAIYAIARHRENTIAAIREFSPVRALIAAPVQMSEAAE
ncbi:hypothetical protein [Rhodoblastus sp.]|uniref:hypothetical protein n=1 Tax=Rhodoblastus sp. TaxID=1962975 RepID=UPI003F9C167F